MIINTSLLRPLGHTDHLSLVTDPCWLHTIVRTLPLPEQGHTPGMQQIRQNMLPIWATARMRGELTDLLWKVLQQVLAKAQMSQVGEVADASG